jgi:hypothetical protein
MEKAYKGMGMEGSVARWYEKTTRKDYEEYRQLARRDCRRVAMCWKWLRGQGFYRSKWRKRRGCG